MKTNQISEEASDFPAIITPDGNVGLVLDLREEKIINAAFEWNGDDNIFHLYVEQKNSDDGVAYYPFKVTNPVFKQLLNNKAEIVILDADKIESRIN